MRDLIITHHAVSVDPIFRPDRFLTLFFRAKIVHTKIIWSLSRFMKPVRSCFLKEFGSTETILTMFLVFDYPPHYAEKVKDFSPKLHFFLTTSKHHFDNLCLVSAHYNLFGTISGACNAKSNSTLSSNQNNFINPIQ